MHTCTPLTEHTTHTCKSVAGRALHNWHYQGVALSQVKRSKEKVLLIDGLPSLTAESSGCCCYYCCHHSCHPWLTAREEWPSQHQRPNMFAFKADYFQLHRTGPSENKTCVEAKGSKPLSQLSSGLLLDLPLLCHGEAKPQSSNNETKLCFCVCSCLQA